MFTVYHSNQLDVLKTLACWQIKNQPLRDPLCSEVVLVQSPGMAQWLQMSLAEEFKIAANIDFPLPASFIWDMFVRVLPDIPKESAFNKSSMSWKLMAILPDMLPGEAFTMLRHYLSDDNDKRKLFQLASRVADLFDQYLVYRPQWLNGWEKGRLTEGLGRLRYGRPRCGPRWWNTPGGWGNRNGTVPIFINALFPGWRTAVRARQICLTGYLSAVFRRCRRSICRR